ncbi:MAG: hypothetical protein A2Y24_02130 [Clostridiales bacterium GWE2_32_10]|nr:MAG: hypothetical protein A2Y24_02130 [Clostridiales bacterium GWE2_32_10]HBY19417.1 DNA-binding response regulator [Clostridiales bacterium]
MNKINIIIVDDHPLIREGLSKILSIDENINILAQGNTGTKAIELIKKYSPDVALLDINMPELSGIDVLKNIKNITTNTRILILTAYDDRKHLKDAINLGADGYILKDSDYNTIISAIKTIHSGKKYIQPELTSYLIDKPMSNLDIDNLNTLTKREREVLLLIGDGLNNTEIAGKLFISEKTVKNHISSIYLKLGLEDRPHAILFVVNNGLR